MGDVREQDVLLRLAGEVSGGDDVEEHEHGEDDDDYTAQDTPR
jgi:hypothetical protein